MTTLSTTNLTTTHHKGNDDRRDQIIMDVGFATAIVVIPINIFFIVSLCRRSQLTNASNWLFLNVALFDILFLVANISLYHVEIVADDSSFYIFLRIAETSCELISSYTTAIIAILRAVTVWRSTKIKETNLTRKQGFSIIFAIWLISAALSGTIIGVSFKIAYTYATHVCLDYVHSLTQVFFVNVAVILCYGYICVVLLQIRKALRSSNVLIMNFSFKKIITCLIVYIIFYTVLTMSPHMVYIIYPDCFYAFENAETLIEVSTILDPFETIGITVLNPVMIYASCSAIRNTVTAMLLQLRQCNAPVVTVDEIDV